MVLHRSCLTDVLPILLKKNEKDVVNRRIVFYSYRDGATEMVAEWRSSVKKTNLWSLIALVALFVPIVPMQGMTAPDVIGTASARGSMRVDGAPVVSNATLFDGSVVETDKATTALRLEKGVEVKLATASYAKLYRDRLILEKGSSEVMPGAGGFTVEANHLHVVPDKPYSRGVVSMVNATSVKVAVISGGFHVTTGSGFLLANIQPGSIMSFDDNGGQGATAPTTIIGCVTERDGKYYLVVPGGTEYLLTGNLAELKHMVGKPEKVTGSPDPNAPPNSNTIIMASHELAARGTLACPIGAAAGAAAAGVATGTWVVLGTIMVGAVAGTAVGVYESQQSSVPASP